MKNARWQLNVATLLLLALHASLYLPATAAAQGVTTGAISGTIRDQQGKPLENAQVSAASKATGFVRGVLSKNDGRYLIPGLEVGDYTVTVRRIGYRQSAVPATVTLGQSTRIDVPLEQQAVVLSGVVVTGETRDNVISPTHTGSVSTVTDSALRRLPSLNRNFTDFVALTPQVSTTGPGLSGGGTNNRYNNIQIDGSTEADLFGLGSTGQPGGQANGKSIGIEAVKEYQVLLSPYDARQGDFAGVLVNAVTKSGTNEWHGSAFGVTRNQNLARNVPFVTDYKQSQYGFSLGGPIVKDKALFFINPEWQTRSTPASGLYLGGQGTSITQAQVDQITSLLSGYNVPTGSAGLVNNQNPLANIFARLDISLPWNTQFVLHDNYGYADQDIFSRSASAFSLTSNGYKFKSKKNGLVGQFRTLFDGGAYNELFLDYTTIRDRRAPNAIGPQITVNAGAGYNVVAGSERFSQGNELDQDITEVTDNLTIPVGGSHRFTIGTQNQFFKVRNLFTQSSYGVWNFGTVDSLQSGQPNQYIVGVPLSGDGAVRFRSANYGAYLQDEWAVSRNLNFTIGLRADIPVFIDKPPFNQSVLDSLGRNTSQIPSGNVQWSPRIGFNWDVTGDLTNQLRGGIGMFTGRPAYVWLSNEFQNSGSVGIGLLTCSNSTRAGVSTILTPAFSQQSIGSPPQSCANGLTARAGGEIDLADPNLKFPQSLRGTLGYDRRVWDNWIVTVEGMYTRGLNGLFYQNIALAGPLGTDATGRVIYGTDANRPVTKRTDRSQVFDISNQSNDHAYTMTGGLQRRFFNNFEGSAFYSFSRAWDAQSFTSSTAFSQYRFGRAWGGDQSDETATRSIFEQRHKFVAQGTYSFPSRTDISLYYIGGSGTPYDYVVNGDPNGDGVTLNDPIYIPKNVSDPNEIRFQDITSGGQVLYTVAQQQQAFDNFINSTKCLRDQRGHLMTRNSCDNPWTNTVNVALRQSLRTVGFQNVSLEVQVFNFLNLLNDRWGLQQTAGFGSQSLLTYRGKTGADLLSGQPIYTFDPTYVKFLSNNINSVYQIQVQARYTF